MKYSVRTLFLTDIAKLRYFVVLTLFLVTSGFPPHANAQKAGSSKGPHAAVGTLKVWVPAGMVGDDYWIYLNGRIVRAPSRGTSAPGPHPVMAVATGKIGSDGGRETNDGWEIWTAEGRILKMRHENYDNSLTSYIGSASGDALHIFQVLTLPLHPGKFTVEVAILSQGSSRGFPYAVSSFPFVITQKYVVDVRPGQITKLYSGVPDDWSETRMIQALLVERVCPKGPVPPDVDQLQRWVKEYTDDPVVKTLREVDASSLARPQGVVVLNLPPAQGGSREFDGSQIGYIVDAISAGSKLPGHRDVAECQRRFPQFSRSYAEYDKMIGFIDDDMESLHKLAAKP